MGNRVHVTSDHVPTKRRTYEVGTTITLWVTQCWSCGIPYGLPVNFQERRLSDGGGWYCPNGHSTAFTDSNEDKQRKRADRAEVELERARKQRETAKVEAAHQRHVAAGHKAHATKIRRRIAAGVCPWCNRTFSNARMTRHIGSKHPEHVDSLDSAA